MDLTTLLHDAVEDVEPADRLVAIRQQTRRPSRRRWYAAGGALLATAAVVAGVAVATWPSDDPRVGPAEPPTTTESTEPAGTARAVYYLGETPTGLRLFREFHVVRAPASGQGAELVTTAPYDEDYYTAWPQGAFLGTVVDRPRGLITVQLAYGWLRDRPAEMSAAQARLAIEQVVYTVQASAQEPLPVQFALGGNPIDQVYGVPTGEPLAAGRQADVLALVSISNPTEGRLVEDHFSADGAAMSFEGTVRWELRAADDTVVDEGYVTGSFDPDRLTPWQTGDIDVSDLSPGDYTFVALTDDPSDGEGPGPTSDTRTVRIR
jgi:hypothetical protein